MNELQIIPPEKESGIVAFVNEQTGAVLDLTIKDAESMAVGIDRGTKIKGALNKLEAMRKEMVGPLNDQVKAINAKFKFFSEPLENAKDSLNKKLIVFQEAERRKAELIRQEAERKAAEEQARIDAEREAAERKMIEEQAKLDAAKIDEETRAAAKKKLEEENAKKQQELADLEAGQQIAAAMVAPVVEKTTRTASGAKITFKQRWVWDLEDIDAVPREFMCVDEAAVKKAISMGIRNIPGIKIYQETNVSQ